MDEPEGLRPAMEAKFTMRPVPWRCMTGATALVHSIGPVRFTSRIFCHSSYVKASRSLKGIHLLYAASLTRMSRRPNVSSTRDTNCSYHLKNSGLKAPCLDRLPRHR